MWPGVEVIRIVVKVGVGDVVVGGGVIAAVFVVFRTHDSQANYRCANCSA